MFNKGRKDYDGLLFVLVPTSLVNQKHYVGRCGMVSTYKVCRSSQKMTVHSISRNHFNTFLLIMSFSDMHINRLLHIYQVVSGELF